MLPSSLNEGLTAQLKRVQVLHQKDLSSGAGRVWLPDALAAKYPAPTANGDGSLFFPPRAGTTIRLRGLNAATTCMNP